MENLKNFQIIIIGAGLSGLTLAREICSRSNYKILILEKKKNYNMIKTGAFGVDPKIHLLIFMIILGKKFLLL